MENHVWAGLSARMRFGTKKELKKWMNEWMKRCCCRIHYFCLEEQSTFRVVLVFDERAGGVWRVIQLQEERHDGSWHVHKCLCPVHPPRNTIYQILIVFLECILRVLFSLYTLPSVLTSSYLYISGNMFQSVCDSQTCFQRTSAHNLCWRDRSRRPHLALWSHHIFHLWLEQKWKSVPKPANQLLDSDQSASSKNLNRDSGHW